MRAPTDALRVPLAPIEQRGRPQSGRQLRLSQPVELMQVKGPERSLRGEVPIDTIPELDLPVDLEVDLDAEIDAAVEAASTKRPRRRGRNGMLPVKRTSRLPESITALNLYLARLKDVEILPIEEQAELAVAYQTTLPASTRCACRRKRHMKSASVGSGKR